MPAEPDLALDLVAPGARGTRYKDFGYWDEALRAGAALVCARRGAPDEVSTAAVPPRKVERFVPDDLEMCGLYTRPQIATLGRVAALDSPREWGGLVEFANESHIYVTLHKTRNEPQHMYRDRIEGDTLFWDSRARHTQESLQIRKLLSGEKPIRFFCRIDDREPFVHCGHLAHVSHTGSEPVASRGAWSRTRS